MLGAVFALVFTWCDSAHAYAWMIRHAYSACSTCHADPSGGELLTTYGRVQGDLLLSMHYGDDDVAEESEEGEESSGGSIELSEPAGTGFLWGLWDTPEWLLLSGSFRNLTVVKPAEEGDAFTYVPVMQGDLYGQLKFGSFVANGSIGVTRAKEGSPHGRPAQLTTGQGDELNVISRVHWLGWDFGEGYLFRAGRLNLPFGVRVPEHTMWVREATRTDRESDQQTGVALAYTGEKWRGEVMAILGNYQINPDEVRDRGYSLFLEGLATNYLAAGVSSKLTYTKLDRYTAEEDVLFQTHGLMARYVPWEPLVIMMEMDLLFRNDTDGGYVGFMQADYELTQGLHLMATGEVLDEGRSRVDPVPLGPGTGEPRLGMWGTIDWFFYRQFEMRLDFIARQQTPFTMLGQLHFYL